MKYIDLAHHELIGIAGVAQPVEQRFCPPEAGPPQADKPNSLLE
jgi:hypothetical protein